MITSSSNPKVKQIVQWQNKAKERRSAGIFLAEGFKMFGEAPEEWIREVYLSEGIQDRASAIPGMSEKLARVGCETVSQEVFRKMSDTQSPQGILCVLKRPQYSLEKLLNIPAPLFLVLENLQDPGNLGTIVRTGEGAGVTGIIMGAGTADLYNPKTIRATMGSVFRVPFVCTEDLGQAVARLRENGVRVYAAHLEGERYYDSFSFREGTAFLIGNEGAGLSAELASRADSYLKIPMEGSVESLNAAVTASILMYEVHRQRHCS
ncbi:MAG TPA: 23S rRNA (guanosine(2251)-2'-O)-methyltransferase RlmB [Lachnospiraceae bacterium]|nr:23S rRNA (guanosine(2251)-2'-O)-methyltransferase RlmB [Lachnospiraceae bacterium]